VRPKYRLRRSYGPFRLVRPTIGVGSCQKLAAYCCSETARRATLLSEADPTALDLGNVSFQTAARLQSGEPIVPLTVIRRNDSLGDPHKGTAV